MGKANDYFKSINYKLFKDDKDLCVYHNKKEFTYLEIYKKTGLYRIYKQEEIPFYEKTELEVVGVAIEELKGIIKKLKELGFKI